MDVANASYTNSTGDALLMAYWKDPDFDPGQRAFYYVRVIEIPTPRWTAYDAKRFGITMPDEVPMTVTDRASDSWWRRGESNPRPWLVPRARACPPMARRRRQRPYGHPCGHLASRRGADNPLRIMQPVVIAGAGGGSRTRMRQSPRGFS